jgi:hypothetical protein
MAVRLSALRIGRCFTPQKHYFHASGTYFCLRLSKPQGPVRPEGLGKLIKIIHLIRSSYPVLIRRWRQCIRSKCPHHYSHSRPGRERIWNSETIGRCLDCPVVVVCCERTGGSNTWTPCGSKIRRDATHISVQSFRRKLLCAQLLMNEGEKEE